MPRFLPAAARRNPRAAAGLSTEQETALLAITQAMEHVGAHADRLGQWRLRQIERALAALDAGLTGRAMEYAGRAVLPMRRIPARERLAAVRLERALAYARTLARQAEGAWR